MVAVINLPYLDFEVEFGFGSALAPKGVTRSLCPMVRSV